jgi:hypothetical protein
MTARRSIRTLRVEAEAALIEKRVFRVMAARDWELLIKIAEIAQADADVRLAQTDPSRFILLRNGVSSWHLKGLTGVTPDSIRKALEKHQIPYLDPADRAAKPRARAEGPATRTHPSQPA